ncbi:GNAT family N-acetyltransferase [Candidatus Dependentiae bacterium]|nr:GNAT family N-acetyltransferase [Candidatus Dependentiae bacterium]
MSSVLVVGFLAEEQIDLVARAFVTPWLDFTMVKERWQRYYYEQQKGSRRICIISKQGIPIGYGTLVFKPQYFYFKENNIPEINDVWVTPEERSQGFGKLIITYLEEQAKIAGYIRIGLGVGLYSCYGPAQRLYYTLGYQPDGKGITYNFLPVTPGEAYCVDDDLILWLTKTIE